MHRVVLLALLALLSVSALAKDRIVSLVIENDSFLDSDRYYTQGGLLSYMWAPQEGLDWLKYLGEQVSALTDKNARNPRTEIALGQNIYTPQDIYGREPRPGDRPYAGWLYLNFGVVVPAEKDKAQDSLVLSLGAVGPAAGGGDVQSWWHHVWGFDQPRGWDSQLHNEAAIQTFAERSWRITLLETKSAKIELLPHAGLALGNVFVYANGGATLRIGQISQKDFGAPRIQPSLPGASYFTSEPEAYLYLGVDTRVVVRNIFLDGNTLHNNYSVDKRRIVGDMQGGAVFAVGSVRIALTQVWRSREYYGQTKRAAFTALSTSILF